MRDLMVFAANLFPEEMIIEEIEKAIKAYRENPIKKNKDSLCLYCVMMATKEATDREGMENVIEKMDKMKQGYDLITPKDQ